MEAEKQKGYQDPLCVVLNQDQRTSDLSVVNPSAPEAPVHTYGPTAGPDQPTSKKASETAEPDRNEATDSSSAWSPEVLQPKLQAEGRGLCGCREGL